MSMKIATYSYFNDINNVRKYTNNPNARGILFCTNDTNRVYIVNATNEIIEVAATNNAHIPVEKPKNHEKIPTNCVNCGAVLTSNQCEYCGTIYR